LFVALGWNGGGGEILSSADGVSWTSKAASFLLLGAVWSGTQFVIVGDHGLILTSPDGAFWTSRQSGIEGQLWGVVWSGAQFVTVGADENGGVILTSSDGILWTKRTSGTPIALWGVVWNGTQFLAVGNGVMLTSLDGISWTKRDITETLRAITWGADKFVAVGDSGTILTSSDGLLWISRASGIGSSLYSITWNGSEFVSVGSGGTILVSADGVSWTSRPSLTSASLSGVAWSGAQYVAVGAFGTILTAGSQLSIGLHITGQPAGQTVSTGGNVTFTVAAMGTVPMSYQWRKGGAALAGATNASFIIANAQPADTGSYDVVVSNGVPPNALSDPAALNVLPIGVSATQAMSAAALNAAGGTVTIGNEFTYAGPTTNLQWRVLLPTGWSFASSDAAGTSSQPTAGATGLIEWNWTAVPASPVRFTYNLTVPAGDLTPDALAALVGFKFGDTAIQMTAKPDPLMAGFSHSADTAHDFRIGLLELTRVIELYNTRNGTVRTGCYKVQDGTEDGFIADPARASGSSATLGRYHSADTRGVTTGSSPNGAIDLLELTRVIELYNYRVGTVRTGQYHVQAGTEDGFAPGP
jgi:hypothetical protein